MTNEQLIDRLQHFACSKELYGCDANALAGLVIEEVLPRMELLDEEACAKHMEERKRMRQEQYGKCVSFDRADVFDAEGITRIDLWKIFSAASRKTKEELL